MIELIKQKLEKLNPLKHKQPIADEIDQLETVGVSLAYIKEFCEVHPTCEGCCMRQDFLGCSFRTGRTPREW